ncbi:putative u4 tri-snrnp-associated protein [Golovinomyces cichoracearum]|uniref:Putative u4 tri-snrnp-associated protein n=1 Tax=Golovinomyces cichoracearum TaxID=62708 RepID=A0A420J2L4_9PEZI|nr:putative u4 tri-snrnp-associated protein [Golovinomyces cichoracearum]
MEETRAYRADSKQKWGEPDRRSNTSYRERDVFRDRYDTRDRDRDRRHRSRSPRDSRYSRSSWRDERDERGSRNRERRHDERDERSGRARETGEHLAIALHEIQTKLTVKDGAEYRDKRGNSRSGRHSSSKRERETRKDARSVSPEVEKPNKLNRGRPETIGVSDRIATPPVSFKVDLAQEFDHMDVDSVGRKANNDRAGITKASSTESQEDEILVEEDGLAAMKAMMGFADFGTTHQKKVPGNNLSAVRKEKKTEYRQYMNRVGGFNRPLSPSHPSR